jgi:hypothetical protein
MGIDSGNNPNVKMAVPFFMVRNIEASIDYYIKGLGFEMAENWMDKGKIRWCWLKIGKAALMLQEYNSNEQTATASIGKLGVGVSIYFICEDALSIYNDVASRGLLVSEPFVGNHMWVVRLSDPDGYEIFFESATDVAEETTYSNWKTKH